VDIQAAFKITAGVTGQQAIDKLHDSVGKLNEGITKIPGMAKAAGMALVGLGAGVSLAVLKGKFDDMVESMLRIKDGAEKVGSTVEKFGALAQAARVTGDDIGVIESGIIKMNKALAGSDDEAKGAAKALSAIGLNIADLRRMDPADAFTSIAVALSKFQDSGGKTALVMDVFGKNGAQLLPFLKDYVEIGDQISKVTAKQAEEAENYDRAVRRLTASKQDLYKVIGVQLLPVANDFVTALLNVSNGTNGVKSAAKGLADDGTFTSVFREGARAAAAMLDVVDLVGKALMQVADSARVVWNDIKVLMSGLNVLNPVAQYDRVTNGKGLLDDFKATVEERNKFLDEANKRMAARFGGSLTPYTDALEKQFTQRDSGVTAPDAKKGSLAGYQSRTPTQQQVADPFQTALDSLGRDAAKFQWQTEHIQQYAEKIDSAREAQVRFDVEQGKFKDLTETQKTLLIMQAEAVDRYAEQLRHAKIALDVTNQTKAIEANTDALGENKLQRDMAAFSQQLENQGITLGTELYAKLTNARRQALERAKEQRANPLLGIQEGMADLGDMVADKATQMKDLLTGAFNSATDALTNFVMTGKLNFKDFARSILADLAKMIIKQQLFNLLSAGKNLLFGGGSVTVSGTPSIAAMAANGAAFDGGVRAFASGGVVNQPTLFKFAQGGAMRNGLMGEAGPEAILPLKRDSAGRLGVAASGGGTGDINVVVQVSPSGGSESVNKSGRMGDLGKMVGAAVRAEIVKQQRPGGLLYA